jgi:hypothetical protein
MEPHPGSHRLLPGNESPLALLPIQCQGRGGTENLVVAQRGPVDAPVGGLEHHPTVINAVGGIHQLRPQCRYGQIGDVADSHHGLNGVDGSPGSYAVLALEDAAVASGLVGSASVQDLRIGWVNGQAIDPPGGLFGRPLIGIEPGPPAVNALAPAFEVNREIAEFRPAIGVEGSRILRVHGHSHHVGDLGGEHRPRLPAVGGFVNGQRRGCAHHLAVGGVGSQAIHHQAWQAALYPLALRLLGPEPARPEDNHRSQAPKQCRHAKAH